MDFNLAFSLGAQTRALFGPYVPPAEPPALADLAFYVVGIEAGVAGEVDLSPAASGGEPPYSWSATGLPSGMTLGSATGVLSWTTGLVAGSYSATITVTGADSLAASRPVTIVVAAAFVPPPPVIAIHSSIVAGYEQHMALLLSTESGSRSITGAMVEGTAPYTWSLISPPSWASMSSDGTLTWATPPVGTGSLTLRVQDSVGNTGSATLAYVCAGQRLDAALGDYALDHQPFLADPQSLYSLTGALPSGLNLCVGGGDLYGVPSAAAAARTVRVLGGTQSRRWRVSAAKHAAAVEGDGTRFIHIGGTAGTGVGTGGATSFNANALDGNTFSGFADLELPATLSAEVTVFNVAGRVSIDVTTTGQLRIQAGAAAISDLVNVVTNVGGANAFADLRAGRRRIAWTISTGASPSAVVWVDGRRASTTNTTLTTGSIDFTRSIVHLGARSSGTSPTNRFPAGSRIRRVAVWFRELVDWSAQPAAWLDHWDPALVGTVDLVYSGTLAQWNAAASGGLITGRCATNGERIGTAYTAVAGTDRTLDANPRAFRDAVGFGRRATGGRTTNPANVFFVTSTSNGTGTGTLRNALNGINRYVRWDVEGAILADSQIQTSDAAATINVTIDGRHAPGLGGWLQNSRLNIRRSNVIVRGCQSFPGSCRQPEGQAYNTRDAFSLGDFAGSDVAASSTNDIYFRDCVGMWGMDETLALTNTDATTSNKPVQRVTFDRCLIAEAMKEAIPSYGTVTNTPNTGDRQYPAQSVSALLFVISEQCKDITLTRCLLTGGEARHPQVHWTSGPVENINVVISNWGDNGAQYNSNGATLSFGDYIGCYFLAGANTSNNQARRPIRLPDVTDTTTASIYLQDVVWEGVTNIGVENGSNAQVTATTNANLFAKSGAAATAIAGSATLSTVLAEAGVRRPGEQRHPWAERVIRYHSAPTRWQASDGWAGGSLPQPNELAATGHTVTAGTGSLTLTLPSGTQMTAHPARPWTGVDFVARLLDSNKVPTSTRTTVSGSATPGGIIAITGLAAGSYVVEVAWKYSGGEARIRPGKEFVVG